LSLVKALIGKAPFDPRDLHRPLAIHEDTNHSPILHEFRFVRYRAIANSN
jgi:hypothetical protein